MSLKSEVMFAFWLAFSCSFTAKSDFKDKLYLGNGNWRQRITNVKGIPSGLLSSWCLQENAKWLKLIFLLSITMTMAALQDQL